MVHHVTTPLPRPGPTSHLVAILLGTFLSLAGCADLQLRDGDRELQLRAQLQPDRPAALQPGPLAADLWSMTRYRFYEAVAGTTATDTFTAPRDGWIESIELQLVPQALTDGAVSEVEVSFLSGSNLTTAEITDAVLAHVKRTQEVLTAVGAEVLGQNITVQLPKPRWIEAGEKLYIHYNSSNVTTHYITFINVNESGSSNRKKYRR